MSSDPKLRIIVTRRLPGVEARMGELFDAVLNTDDHPFTRDELVAAMRDCDVLVPCVNDRIDAEMFAQAMDSGRDRMKLIANFGAGLNHLDLAACHARGIVVTNTPDVFTEDTADITMALILMASRRLSEGVRMVAAGEWTGWAPSAMLGRTLKGKVLGIVGMGRIGQALARRAQAFEMQVIYNNRRRLTDEGGAAFEPDLDALIARSDYLSLNCPATPETQGLLDARRIAAMKPGSFVINSGRGDLIDEEALIAALESGHLGGAGLDVYVGEPKLRPQFMSLKNVVALPHLGSATVEGRTAAGEKIIANILAWAAGETPPDLVNTKPA